MKVQQADLSPLESFTRREVEECRHLLPPGYTMRPSDGDWGVEVNTPHAAGLIFNNPRLALKWARETAAK